MPVKLTTEKFIERSKLIHGDRYNYSLVDYIGSKLKVKIICSQHGEFIQKPNHHLGGVGCPICGGTNKLNTFEIIKQFQKVHEDRYDYSLVDYKNDNYKVDIICSKHGKFSQSPTHHKQGKGCPVCRESKGESMISKLLNKNKIEYIREKRFKDCKNIVTLPFDFYLPEYNICIEFHGKQHFKMECHFGKENGFEDTNKRDKIKELFCKENNISLIIVFEYGLNSKNYKFVDLYENSNKNVINFLIHNNIDKITLIEYNIFKKSFYK